MAPMYDFQCKRCGEKVERRRSAQDVTPEPCPKCPEKEMERQFPLIGGFIFKGSGFHNVDYRKKNK